MNDSRPAPLWTATFTGGLASPQSSAFPFSLTEVMALVWPRPRRRPASVPSLPLTHGGAS